MNYGSNINLTIGEKSVFEIFHRVFPRDWNEGIIDTEVAIERILKRRISDINEFSLEQEKNKNRNFRNPHNSGKVSKSLGEFIKESEKLTEVSSAIREILKNPKNYTINELVGAINDIENQLDYSSEEGQVFNNEIQNITTYILDIISNYETCFKALQRKINTQLLPFRDVVSLFKFSRAELREEEFKRELAEIKGGTVNKGSSTVIINSEYDFSRISPISSYGEFYRLTNDIENLKHRQDCLGQLKKIGNENLGKAYNCIHVLKEMNSVLNNLLHSDVEYGEWNGHLVASFYGSSGREQDIYDDLFKEILYGRRKGSKDYNKVFYDYLMDNLKKIERIPIKLKELISILEKVPFLQEYLKILLENLNNIEPLLKKEQFMEGNPFFDMMKKNPEGGELDGEYLGLYSKKRYNSHLNAISFIFENLYTLESLIKIAIYIDIHNWKDVELNHSNNTEYQNGWHPGLEIIEGKIEKLKINKNQVLNHSPDNTQLTAYSGPNTSGKTFTGLQRDFYIRVAMQSFGFAPVESGNIGELFDLIIYMDRATTNAKDSKSAYMQEVARLKTIFDENPNKKILFYIDEPFSTTSPIDQSGMIALLVDYIKSRGGKCIIATHNEVFLESQIDNPGTNLYYFPIINGVKTRILTKGIGTSDFFEVARMQGFREDIILDAEKYLKGELTIDLLNQYNFIYSPGEENSIANLFPSVGEGYNPLLGLYSRDSDFNFINGVGSLGTDRSFMNLDKTIINRLLAKMFFNAPVLSLQALQERQDLFSKLIQNNIYSELAELISYLVEVEHTFRELKGDNDNNMMMGKTLKATNEQLNPIKMYENKEAKNNWLLENINIEKITAIIKYIGFNKILFGETISEEAITLMSELKRAREVLESFEDILKENQKNKEVSGKKYYYINDFLEKIFGLNKKEETESQIVSDILEIFKGENKTKEIIFDENTNNLIKILCDKLFPSESFETISDMINAIKGYFENLLTDSANISKSLPEIKLNDPRLTKKSFLLRIFDNGGIFKNEDEFKKTKQKVYRIKRLSESGSIVFNTAMMKGNVAKILLTLIQAKKDYEELKAKFIGLNNPIITPILEELDNAFYKMWNEEGIDMVDSKEEDKRVGRNHLGRDLEGKEIIGRETAFFQRSSNFGREKKVEGRGKFTTHLHQLSALCAFSAIIKNHGLTKANIHTSTNLELINAGNIFEDTKKDHRNSLTLNNVGEIGKILTGPNGSGKTYYAKEMITNIQLALSTGWTYADSSSIPKFEKIIYLDRVIEVDDNTSSGALELGYWSEVLETIDNTSGPILLFADEIFSTTSQKYQGAFMVAIVKKLVEKGVYFMISNHHGEVTEWLIKNAPNRVLPYHFGFTITPEQKIIYHRNLLPGIEKSYAREVARTMGLF